jgi:hypothetical protein
MGGTWINGGCCGGLLDTSIKEMTSGCHLPKGEFFAYGLLPIHPERGGDSGQSDGDEYKCIRGFTNIHPGSFIKW